MLTSFTNNIFLVLILHFSLEIVVVLSDVETAPINKNKILTIINIFIIFFTFFIIHIHFKFKISITYLYKTLYSTNKINISQK